MRTRIAVTAAFIAALVMVMGVPASASHVLWEQDFSTDADGWLDSDDGWFGTVTLNGGTETATFEGGGGSAPFSRFDEYRDTWPGDYIAEIDVYLDPAWPVGSGFDYTVAANGSDGAHQRDYIFHVGVHADGRLLVNGSNNTDFTVNDYKLVNDGDGTPYEVTSAGWYTMQHAFRDDGGALAVDLNLLDSSGTQVFTTTRFNAADTIPAEVGGNRYAWFTFLDVLGGMEVDNHELYLDVPDTTPPVATISAPSDGDVLAGSVDVIGSVTDDHELLRYYTVVRDAGGTNVGGPGTVYEDESFTGRTLFTFDTTTVADGTYTVFLAARDAADNRGPESEDSVTVLVDNPDADGLIGEDDNCPDDFNPGQEDADLDGVGDACDDYPTYRDGKQEVIDELTLLLADEGLDDKDRKRIEKAIERIEDSMDPDYWSEDGGSLTEDGKKVFDDEKKAVKELEKVDTVDVQDQIDHLVAIDATLAENAIAEASDAVTAMEDGKDKDKAQKELDKALDELQKAEDELADGDHDKAIGKYKKAWERAMKAIERAAGE